MPRFFVRLNLGNVFVSSCAGALLLLFSNSCPAQYAEFRSKDYSTGDSWLGLLDGKVKGYRIEAHFFHVSEYELCIVDEGDTTPIHGNLENAMRNNSCTAGVNGGYFAATARRSPIGLLRHTSRTISPFSTGSFTVIGTLYDTGENIFLDRSSALRVPLQRMREAIQGGPFLIDRYRAVPGLERTRKAMRTFVATDGAGQWCLAITSPLSLHELASILSQPKCMGNFRVHTALNMDGGSSCSFWDQTVGIYRPGFKSVRNYIGIRPRQKYPLPANRKRH